MLILSPTSQEHSIMESIFDFNVVNIKDESTQLNKYRGNVVLIVNTASDCGFTTQYKGLEALYKKYKDQGLVILGFPCNQFGHQEKEENDKISQFCEINYGVTFPLFSKVDVNGDNAEPLFEFIKNKAPGLLGSKTIKWNFTKFLVGRDGVSIKRFAPKDKPESLETTIVESLTST